MKMIQELAAVLAGDACDIGGHAHLGQKLRELLNTHMGGN